MKTTRNILIVTLFTTIIIVSCKSFFNPKINNYPPVKIDVNMSGQTPFYLSLKFDKGTAHNHPLMVIWAEDLSGKYLETFFIAKSIGGGVFERATGGGGKWFPGPISRPAALPYWAHKRGVKEINGSFNPTPLTAMPDAISGATPKGDFELFARPSITNFPDKFNLLFEINQSWDWNEYWTNAKYLDEPEYKTSCQPSVVYQATLDINKLNDEILLTPIGHGHYSGKTGELFTDLSTITSALKIAKKIRVSLRK
ncbi:MAG: hypothetical protein WCP69_12115 [Bacteroidota bacterium]